MAFRLFRSNPSIGGFGNESITPSSRGGKKKEKRKQEDENGCGDAFAQILKELVDNAVDACSHATQQSDSGENDQNLQPKRVRIHITAIDGSGAGTKSTGTNDETSLLRIEVHDNGCGMQDIDKYVSAFSSNKANGEEVQSETVGRYGIGLPLCILHAQRLVPGSVTKITSSTRGSPVMKWGTFGIDIEQDKVICCEKGEIVKKDKNMSGTVIKLLLPGGREVKRKWPRLAEYFARFQLSLQLKCSVEVLAPSLSKVPLYIRPPDEKKHCFPKKKEGSQMDNDLDSSKDLDLHEKNDGRELFSGTVDEGEFHDNIDDDFGCSQISSSSVAKKKKVENQTINEVDSAENESFTLGIDDLFQSNIGEDGNGASQPQLSTSTPCSQEDKVDRRRRRTRDAVSKYLGKEIKLENVAHSCQSIFRGKQLSLDQPMIEVDMIVHEYNDDDDVYAENEHQNLDSSLDTAQNLHDRSKANVMLVRMVNHVPLLDGAESVACGITLGLHQKTVWNSFGLEISTVADSLLDDDCKDSFIHEGILAPTFCLRDSAHVELFISKPNRNHAMMSDDEVESTSNGSDSEDSDIDNVLHSLSSKRKKRRGRSTLRSLKPAGLRLGNILVIVQLSAKSVDLPLPTLSKGRLPMNDSSINAALHTGLTKCLRSLQSTNPELLLTASELKKTEREVTFIPSIASALASLTLNCNDDDIKRKCLGKIDLNHENVKDNSSSTRAFLSQKLESILQGALTKLDEDKRKEAEERREKKRNAKRTKRLEHVEDTFNDSFSGDEEEAPVKPNENTIFSEKTDDSSTHELDSFGDSFSDDGGSPASKSRRADERILRKCPSIHDDHDSLPTGTGSSMVDSVPVQQKPNKKRQQNIQFFTMDFEDMNSQFSDTSDDFRLRHFGP